MQPLKQLLPQTSLPSQAPQATIPGMEEGGKKSSKAISPEARRRVELVFKTFTKHYGAQRMASHWGTNGLKPEEAQESAEGLKRYWAYELRDTSHRAVLYAMDNLPNPFPPTVDEFLEIARRCPQPYVAQLDVKETAEEREERQSKAQARLAEIRAKFPKFRKPEPITDEELTA